MSPLSRRVLSRIAGLGAAAALAFAAVAVPAVTGEAAARTAPEPGAVGPGVRIATPLGDGAELCTANFLFTGDDGTRYLGTAAHCTAAAGAGGSVDGCVEPVQPVGTTVAVVGRDGRAYGGTVAYNSWSTMQARGEADRAACTYNDLALIALSPAAAAVADPTVPGLGGPVALDTDGTRDGETVYSHQPHQTPATPDKQGVSLGMPQGPRTHVVLTVPPGIPGDSGAGYLDARGNAFGVLSSLMLPTAANGVTDLARALDYAAEHGPTGPVDLVPGTAPFAPGALPLTERPDGPQLPGRPLPELTPVPLR